MKVKTEVLMRYLAIGTMALAILFGACSKPGQSERERAVRAGTRLPRLPTPNPCLGISRRLAQYISTTSASTPASESTTRKVPTSPGTDSAPAG